MSRSAFSSNQLNVVGPGITTSAISGGPPANPTDGDIWIASAVDSNGTRWTFQYNAGSSSAYKWEFIGGAPMTAHYDYPGGVNLGTSTFVTLTGCTVTLPRNGDYSLIGSCTLETSAASGRIEFIGLFGTSAAGGLVGAGSSYLGYCNIVSTTGGMDYPMAGQYPATGCTAGDVISIQGWCNATGTNLGRLGRLAVTPVRIS